MTLKHDYLRDWFSHNLQFKVNQKQVSIALPWLVKDHVVHSLLLLGQFETMHCTASIREGHLKQGDSFPLARSVICRQVPTGATVPAAAVSLPVVFPWNPAGFWCAAAEDSESGCWVSPGLSWSRCPPVLSTACTHRTERSAGTCRSGSARVRQKQSFGYVICGYIL